MKCYYARTDHSPSITWDDGAQQDFQQQETPKLRLENGRPKLLSLATQPVKSEDLLVVIIPLNQQPEN